MRKIWYHHRKSRPLKIIASVLFIDRIVIRRGQQTLSWLLIAAILILNTVRIPFEAASAEAQVRAVDLVSLIVERDLYTDSTRDLVDRYAEDIQAALPDTRAAIFIIDSDIHPQNIAALNEKLYYEWDGTGVSQLVGTILIGDVPLPVVHDSGTSFLSIYPYIDFREKNFIFDESEGKFVKRENDIADASPEVWHSVVAPNTGDESEDRRRLSNFFEKSHEFHTSQGRFSERHDPPYVFYFDAHHDQLSTRLISWESYSRYLENIESFAYNRHNKHLAEELYEAMQSNMTTMLGGTDARIQELLAAQGLSGSDVDSGMRFSAMPDVQSRRVIDKTVEPFYGILNPTYIGDLLWYARNTGRYGATENVRVDIASVLVAKQDELIREILRSGNTSVEDMIDSIIEKSIATPLYIPTRYDVDITITSTWTTNSGWTSGGWASSGWTGGGWWAATGWTSGGWWAATGWTSGGWASSGWTSGGQTTTRTQKAEYSYQNYLYGRRADTVTHPKHCSIARGSSLVVEANRGFNVLHSQEDADLLFEDLPEGQCFAEGEAKTMVYWWGGSPLNLDMTSIAGGDFDMKLRERTNKWFIRPAFDLRGSREIPFVAPLETDPSAGHAPTVSGSGMNAASSGSGVVIAPPPDENLQNTTAPIRVASPFDCYDGAMVLQPYTQTSSSSSSDDSSAGQTTTTYYPEETGGGRLSCISEIRTMAPPSYESVMSADAWPCVIDTVILDASTVKQQGAACTTSTQDETTTTQIKRTFEFRSVSSVLEHKSPTDSELSVIAWNLVTPSIPIDRDRYVDFLDANGDYAKIVYPNFFRIDIDDLSNLNLDFARTKVIELLDQTSASLNAIPGSPGDIDLTARLESTPEVLDTITESVLWNNLDNITAKYAFALEKQLNEDAIQDDAISDHKEDYEIASLISTGEAEAMYVKVDPETTSEPPASIAGIMQSANEYRSARDASNVWVWVGNRTIRWVGTSAWSGAWSGGWSAQFECGPPEGVPIWEWLPAIFCWLGTILPPTISAGSCSETSLLDYFRDDFENDFSGPVGDGDANGILDAREAVRYGSIDLSSDAVTLSHSTSGELSAVMLSEAWEALAYDSFSRVEFSVDRVVDIENGEREIVYDSSDETLDDPENLEPYVQFASAEVPVTQGRAGYAFSTKNRDSDITFQARVNGENAQGETVFTTLSNPVTVRVRADRLQVTESVRTDDDSDYEIGTHFIAGNPYGVRFDISRLDSHGSPVELSGGLRYRLYDAADRPIFEGSRDIEGSVLQFGDPILRTAGSYRFEFFDADGLRVEHTFTVLPAPPSQLDVTPSTSVHTPDESVYILIQPRDVFGNIVNSEFLTIRGEIVGGPGRFVDQDGNPVETLERTSFEGYTTYELRSDEIGETSFKFRIVDEAVETPITSIETTDFARLSVQVENSDRITAWGSPHAVALRVTDEDGATLRGYNGVVALDFPSVSGQFHPAYVQIVDGENRQSVTFTPGYVAGNDISASIALPGVSQISWNTLTVLPDAAMEIALSLEKDAVEAEFGTSNAITATLYDRYGNLAWNHRPMSAEFFIEEQYQKFVRLEGNASSARRQFEQWRARMNAIATSLPGTAYISARTTPDLSTQSFTVTGRASGSDAATLTISGLGADAVRFDSYYHYDGEKIRGNHYNALFSVMAGADYGNITVPGYLAGEAVFDADSRALAVSTLLGRPYSRDEMFSFTSAWQYESGNGSLAVGLEASIVERDGATSLDFYDSVTRERIARADISMSRAVLVACDQPRSNAVEACGIPADAESYILAASLARGSRVETVDGVMSLSMGDTRIFSVDETGVIDRAPTTRFEIDPSAPGNFLGIRVFVNRTPVWYLAYRFSRMRVADQSAELSFSDISARYGYEYIYAGNSSKAEKGIRFYRADTGGADDIDRKKAGPFQSGLEYATERTGIGWEGDNTFLLEFTSGGTSLGDATRAYQSYLGITIGDPTISLPVRADAKKFDQGIGKRLYNNSADITEASIPLDFNGDDAPDIAVFSTNGAIRLLANTGGKYRDMGYLASVADAGRRRKDTGDFRGDGYDDIVMADEDHVIFLLENTRGKFERRPLLVFDEGASAPRRFDVGVMQLQTYDMDVDGYTDIVTVDEAGELNILYGRADGRFDKKLIDSGFGVRITGKTRSTEGAVYFDGLRQITPTEQRDFLVESEALRLSTETDVSGWMDEATARRLVDAQIYYTETRQTLSQIESVPTTADIAGSAGTDDSGAPREDIAESVSAGMASIEAMGGTTDFLVPKRTIESRTYIRSEYAEGENLRVEKTYTDRNGDTLQTDDIVDVTVRLTNTGDENRTNVEYLDSYEKNVFDLPDTAQVSLIQSNGEETTLSYDPLVQGEYDLSVDVGELPAGASAEFSYTLESRPIAYGEVLVGDLGSDAGHGEIAVRANNVCGESYTAWHSTEPYPRTYATETLDVAEPASLPSPVTEDLVDADQNGIPDIAEAFSDSDGDISEEDLDAFAEYAEEALDEYQSNEYVFASWTQNSADLLVYDEDSDSVDVLGMSSADVDSMIASVNNIVEGLGCGFGGGSCLSMPLNWAPLAPGSAPTIFGFPAGILDPSTGIPIFSGINWVGLWPLCLPGVWPPLVQLPFPVCGGTGAGGFLGTLSPTNVFRLYITPTLTLGVGVAACFGGPSAIVGRVPPPGVSPLVPGGNCVVAARPLWNCEADGSDGDVGEWSYTAPGHYTNAGSCTPQSQRIGYAATPEERQSFQERMMAYISGDSSVLSSLWADITRGTSSDFTSGQPLISSGLPGGGGDPNLEVEIDTDALQDFDFENVVKISLDRIPAFPDFLMEWVTRQLEEIINKLTSLPTLYIILPDFSLFETSGWVGFTDKIEQAYDDAAAEYEDIDPTFDTDTGFEEVEAVEGEINSFLAWQSDNINTIGRNISGIKAAYEFLSNLPLLSIEPETVHVRIPWIPPEDIEKWILDAEATLKQWEAEFDETVENWEQLGTEEGALEKVNIEAGALLQSLRANIQTLKEYKEFPEKLLRYLEYKEIYAEQILCNIEAIEFFLGGWLAENAARFRAWVELYILIRAILEGWQLIIDIFVEFDANCGVCRNERWDLKHFLIKLLSMVIPDLPIIIFPKWPDIILDLHNIRAGLVVPIPEFDFDVTPLVLPALPELDLPDVPTLTLALPVLPLLPKIPPLPSLPDIPSLPLPELPSLPPPPTIPALFGIIEMALQILRLIALIICILRTNPFAPEWRVGDLIAQLTERQGTLPIDFLFLEFPQFSMSFIDAIKVTTYVNLEFELDFIIEMASSTMKPFNTFTANLSNATSHVKLLDLDFSGTIPEDIEIDASTGEVRGLEDVGELPEALEGLEGFAPTHEYMRERLGAIAHFASGSLHRLAAGMQSESERMLSVSELSDEMAAQIPALKTIAPDIAARFEAAVSAGSGDADEITAELQQTQRQKFDVLKSYIREDMRRNNERMAELRKIIQKEHSLSELSFIQRDLPHLITIIANTQAEDELRKQAIEGELRALNDRIADPLSRILDPSTDPMMRELSQMRTKALSQLHEAGKWRNTSWALALGDTASSASFSLAADTSSASGTYDIADSYRYNYEGIYYLDAGGNQTRLFNYTELLTGREKARELDIDDDGDRDLIYTMNNITYLKTNHTNTPESRHITDAPRTRDLSAFLGIDADDPVAAGAPENFSEDFATTGRINASFDAADIREEQRYRLEMYDYVDRFDRVKSGETPRSITPATARQYVDLVTRDDSALVTDSTRTGAIIGRAPARVRSSVGDIRMRGLSLEFVNPGETITIRAGSRVYAGGGGAEISYLRSTQTASETVTLAPNAWIEFSATTQVSVSTGRLVLLSESLRDGIMLGPDELSDMPIVPDVRLSVPEGGRIFLEYFDDGRLILDTPSEYEMYDLGERDGDYSISLDRPNGLFYARLAAFDKSGELGTWASQTLLSPQTAADATAPSILAGSRIRIPVYQPYTLDLQGKITDLGTITRLWLDMDLDADSDGDGNPKNDNDSLSDSLEENLSYGATTRIDEDGMPTLQIDFTPYDEIMEKTVRLFVEDDAGNIATKDMTLSVYAPTPIIEGYDGESTVVWRLDESLEDMPVDLLRLRNGFITKVDPEEEAVHTGTGGRYEYTESGSGGALISRDGETIAAVNFKTGLLELVNGGGYTIRALARDGERDMRLELSDESGIVVYRQTFGLPAGTRIIPIADFSAVSTDGAYLRVMDPAFRYEPNDSDAPVLPDGGFLVRSDGTAIVGFDERGHIIAVSDSDAELVYDRLEDFILMRVQSGEDTVVEILYRLDIEYAIR